MRMLALIVVAVNASVLLVSAAGIPAMMSFTVARRSREIGSAWHWVLMRVAY